MCYVMRKIIFFIIFCVITQCNYAQVLTSVSPTSAQQGQSLGVTISGTNLHFLQASSTMVWFDQGSSTVVYPLNIIPSGNNSLVANFNFPITQNVGWYNVNVYNDIDGFIMLPSSFAITANPNSPHLISVNPNNALQGQLLNVSISGTNTHFSQATNTTIWFEQGSSTIILPLNIQSVSNTTLNAYIHIDGQQQTGLYNLHVNNGIDGNLSLLNCFTVNYNPNQPHLVNVNPNNATQGDVLNVTISGQNTHFNQGTATITWFQQGSSTIIYPNSQNSVSETNINANYLIPTNANTGYYDTYTFNNTDGLLVLNNSFYISFPIIYTIIANANPSNGGYITGIGNYNANQMCTLNAIAFSGYYFVNWTENGNVVSSNPGYSFSVNSNRILTANFSPVNQFYISTMVLPAFSGNTTGSGAYNSNQMATVHATPNTGWYFLKWTENGNLVSYDSIYTFSVTSNRTLVANFNMIINVDENKEINNMGIYPNPASHYFYLDMNNNFNNITNVLIYDVLGKLVYNQVSSNENLIKVNVEKWENGVYFINIKQKEQKNITKKLFVNN